MFWGIILVVVGVVMLLKNLGIITADMWDVLWPVVVIAVGLSFLPRRHAQHLPWCRCGDCAKPNP